MSAAEAEALWQSGVAAYGRKAYVEAVKLFEQAADLDPATPRRHIRLATARLATGDLAGARHAADEARRLGPDQARGLDALGYVYSTLGDHDAAIDLFRQAVALAPEEGAFRRNLGWAALHSGALAESEAIWRRLTAENPRDAEAWFALATQVRQTPADNFAAPLEALAANPPADPNQTLMAAHALSRTYEDLGEWRRSLDVLARAKTPLRGAYNVGVEIAAMQAAADLWRGQPAGPGWEEAAPIFVVGSPRSGTTLADRILSSHLEIVSAGELRAFPLVGQALTGRAGQPPRFNAQTLADVAALPPQALGIGYLRAAAAIAGDQARFVDKLPFNFLNAGAILAALPQARVIWLRRGLADTILGNYRQLFALQSPFHGYAYDLGDTTRYIIATERLRRHWQAVLPPDRFMTLNYEALVADPRQKIAELLAFCGLTWDERCLNFQDNPAGVSTASAAQVREPLNDRSIGRWRAYGDALAPVLAALEEAGLEP